MNRTASNITLVLCLFLCLMLAGSIQFSHSILVDQYQHYLRREIHGRDFGAIWGLFLNFICFGIAFTALASGGTLKRHAPPQSVDRLISLLTVFLGAAQIILCGLMFFGMIMTGPGKS